ncbi:arsenical resistance operon transcriptional repressor ArsD [Salibacterium salarium]|uniref:Arsenical resistance operon transcriptional repressor ArsD n=1 Tax=Salibacterium salarium TaxID=284579 RepID=A0A3R9QSX7_9BACI|nr:arsenite efflux transporter metallochaperone ArsD [Salibacterium salarium]RSL32693.1 arsenical resistance operon transcriptional repressor ArsD [Salibacterium salarium]
MKLEIYDPALCCPTGVCGPDVDPELTRIAADIHVLQQHKADIQRYNLAQEPEPFVQQMEVGKLMEEEGTEVLPVSVLDGKVVKTAGYPSREELSEWFGMDRGILENKPAPSRVDISIK